MVEECKPPAHGGMAAVKHPETTRKTYGSPEDHTKDRETVLTRDEVKRLLIWDALGALGAAGIASFFSRDYLYSLATGFAMVYMIEVFLLLHRFFLRPRIGDLPRVRRVLIEIGVSFGSHLTGGVLGALLVMFLFGRFTILVILYLVTFSLFFPAIHSLQYVRMFHRELRETELQEERLRALAAEAELKALKAQINPHFLFNTLNTVAHLIRTDPPRAEKTVEKLAEVFRYALVAVEKDVVPLADELSFIEDYLALEHERFGDRLLVESSVAPDTLQIMVPPLFLQPLVENALRHGQGPQGEAQLNLETYLNEQSLVISISDRGPGFPTHTTRQGGSGIGLRNVRERLERKYGPGFGLELAQNEPNGAKITITIPKEQP
jgi:signal transduction histidine kinase